MSLWECIRCGEIKEIDNIRDKPESYCPDNVLHYFELYVPELKPVAPISDEGEIKEGE